MQVMDLLSVLFRWIHIVAGILWIGMLYFFNFVNAQFAASMESDTKKKVVPELMPRALYWFRWGAAYTWITGVLLLLLVFYHGGIMFPGEDQSWSPAAMVMVLFVFVAPFLYDILAKSGLAKNLKIFAIVGFILTAVAMYVMIFWAGFDYRAYVIHIGAMFGTIMAFNVWFRIWPAQKKIISATKEGNAPDAALVAQAGSRSRHNTYLSIPLIWTMINQHSVVPAASSPLYLLGVILLGWLAVAWIYGKAGKVKGF